MGRAAAPHAEHKPASNPEPSHGDKGLPGPAGDGRGPYAPFGEADDVPRLDEAADLVPHGNGDAARLVGHLAGPHLVPVLGLGDAPCGGRKGGKERGREGGGKRVAGHGAARPRLRGTWAARAGRGGRHLPISSTIKTTFKFFSPGFMSFIKTYASLAALMLRPAGGTGLAGDGAVPASRGAAAAERGRAGGTGSPHTGRGHGHRGTAKSLGGSLDSPTAPSPHRHNTHRPPPAPAGTKASMCSAPLYIPIGHDHPRGRAGGSAAEWNRPAHAERGDWATGGRVPAPRADWSAWPPFSLCPGAPQAGGVRWLRRSFSLSIWSVAGTVVQPADRGGAARLCWEAIRLLLRLF